MYSTGREKTCENCGYQYSEPTVHVCHPGYTSRTAQPTSPTWTVSVPVYHPGQPQSWKILDVTQEEYDSLLDQRRQKNLKKRIELLVDSLVDMALSPTHCIDDLVKIFPEIGEKEAERALGKVVEKAKDMKRTARDLAIDLLGLGDSE